MDCLKSQLSAQEILEGSFLENRARILEVAAFLSSWGSRPRPQSSASGITAGSARTPSRPKTLPWHGKYWQSCPTTWTVPRCWGWERSSSTRTDGTRSRCWSCRSPWLQSGTGSHRPCRRAYHRGDLARGFRAGVTLYRNFKCSPARTVDILERYGIELIRKVIYDNPATFFGQYSKFSAV